MSQWTYSQSHFYGIMPILPPPPLICSTAQLYYEFPCSSRWNVDKSLLGEVDSWKQSSQVTCRMEAIETRLLEETGGVWTAENVAHMNVLGIQTFPS